MKPEDYATLVNMAVAPPLQYAPLRLGQAMFHKATDFDPDLEIPQEADCFYDDTKIGAFLNFVATKVDSQ